MANQTEYQRICAEACEWCRKGLRFRTDRYGRPYHVEIHPSDHSCDRWMDQEHICTAPTKDAVIDRFAGELEQGHAAYRRLCDSLEIAGNELARVTKERDELKRVMDQVDDVLIVNWVGPRVDGDYRRALADLVSSGISERQYFHEAELAALKAERAEDTARLGKLEALRQNEKLCVSLNNSNGSCDEAPKGHAVYSTESDEEYTEITAPTVRELIDKISATANWPSPTTGSTPSAIEAARAAGKEGE